jgi:hypothetical protein
MKTSESIKDFAIAYSAAQGVLTNPPKNKVNPHFKSSYVDLSDGLDVIRKCFSKHGLSFIQGTSIVDGMIVLNTRIMHISGQWIESDYPVGGFGKPQEMGSSMTYARRYALFGLVGVAGEDDDDGNAAQSATPTPIKAAKAAPKQMEPGVSPDDSTKLLGVIRGAMKFCKTVEALSDWAGEHKEQIAILLPAHRKELETEYKSYRDELKANG